MSDDDAVKKHAEWPATWTKAAKQPPDVGSDILGFWPLGGDFNFTPTEKQ